jgi:hypothetical protein
MATPESKVKQAVKRVLDAFDVYFFMPVNTGLGAAGVDFHCVVKVSYLMDAGWMQAPIAFFIETKEEGKKPTARQELFLEERRAKQG